MPDVFLEPVVPERRAAVSMALTSTFGAASVSELHAVPGGASGASIYRFAVGGRNYLLRLEVQRSLLRNPHQHACMKIAADAGIAPALHHADANAGVTIMDFVVQRPLTDYPGGPTNLARDLGSLIARLQSTDPFPALHEYPIMLERMLGYLRSSGAFAEGLLDPHVSAFERIRSAYPWNAAARTSSHNDPNPNNILFDGRRLWLIDWETSYRNEPLIDLAILSEHVAGARELQDALLHSWLGKTPDKVVHARLTVLRPLTRLYYAGLLFAIAAAGSGTIESHADLAAPTPAEFRAAIADGRLRAGSPAATRTFAKMLLAGFLSGSSGTEFEEALAIVRAG